MSSSTSGFPGTNSPDTKTYTSILALNRYNKIHTTEFKEEDIEIMNINTILALLNLRLKKITNVQCFLIFLSFFIFLLDVSYQEFLIRKSSLFGFSFHEFPYVVFV